MERKLESLWNGRERVRPTRESTSDEGWHRALIMISALSSRAQILTQALLARKQQGSLLKTPAFRLLHLGTRFSGLKWVPKSQRRESSSDNFRSLYDLPKGNCQVQESERKENHSWKACRNYKALTTPLPGSLEMQDKYCPGVKIWYDSICVHTSTEIVVHFPS